MTPTRGWRTVDVVVGSALGVAFGAVFQGWNLAWTALSPAFVAVPPLQGAMYGVWMLPAVIAALVIRRPGAALLGETVAAAASMFLGAPWAMLTVVYGLAQGLAAEVVFGMTGYRAWRLPVAVVAGAAAGAAGALIDLAIYYPTWSADWQLLYLGLVIPSAALVAGVGGWLLVRGLAASGALAPFAAGREQPEV